MLSDLRKYITNKIMISSDTTGWFLKMILERSKNENLVNQFLRGVEENQNAIVDEETDPFADIISDYMLSDVLNIQEDNIILNLILSCFTNQFIIEDFSFGGILEAFVNLTGRGRQIFGIEGNNYLSDYIQSDFKVLEYEFSGASDEVIIEAVKGIDDDFCMDYEFNSMCIILDEIEMHYGELSNVLAEIGFVEVTPGLFYYICFGYCGYGTNSCLTFEAASSIVSVLLNHDKLRNIDTYDNALNVFNTLEAADNYLYLLFKERSSVKEVLF